MPIRVPFQTILAQTQKVWGQCEFRTAARRNFKKMLQCGIPTRGGDRYASDFEERVVYHTCKLRMCPKCGRRMALPWQIEQMAALPDMPYAGIAFTMPDVLWPIFQQNRHLLHDLEVLGAQVIQNWSRPSTALA